MPTVLNIAHIERGERRIGAGGRERECYHSQKRARDKKSEKNVMRVPENVQTNRCQMRLKSVGWTVISHNSAIIPVHYPAKARHNVCITLL